MLLATLLAIAVTATTTPATNVTATGATLNGTVEGAATARFEYSTGTTFENKTAIQTVTADGPVTEEIEGGLTFDTTYRFRVVANPGAPDEAVGQALTFTTGGPPGVSDQRSSNVTPTSATVSASINTKGLQTSYRIQWGTSTRYGRFTPTVTAETGTAAANVVLTGLLPNRTYHWRTRASNAAGTTLGPDKTFKTGPAPTGISLAVSRGYVPWGAEVRLGGRVSGAGVNGLIVVLEQQRFPLDSAFAAVDTARTGRDGGYLFTIPRLWTTTNYRVSTQTAAPVTSPVAIARSVVKVGGRARHVTRRRAAIEGAVLPAVHGTASLQRRIGKRWRQVARRTIAPADSLRSRYRFGVWRAKRFDKRFRVKVSPVRGAHVRGWSRSLKVRRR
jgi:hypothetical protein